MCVLCGTSTGSHKDKLTGLSRKHVVNKGLHSYRASCGTLVGISHQETVFSSR